MRNQRKVLLCILDGWGYSTEKEYNAIHLADTPCIDDLWQNRPHALLKASGADVGLPDGQMGNSKVGHTAIGAGRIVPQNLLRFHELTKNKEKLNSNPALIKLVENTKGKVCHILGLISDGGIHSHTDHIISFAKFLLHNGIKVKLHAFTDGRDISPKSAIKYIQKILDNEINIASISGRYYAMDRDKRWDRIELAYNAITAKSGKIFDDPKSYINQSYDNGDTDEFIIPAHHKGYQGIQDGDSLLIANFRVDRIREIAKAFLADDFNSFKRKKIKFSYAVGATKYSDSLSKVMGCIMQPEEINNDLGEYLSNRGLKQLRVAETEKYAHVTYFFNCGRNKKMPNEDWLLVPSPKVATYDLTPEMSAYQITDELINACKNDHYDFICINYSNADMVGHTGNLEASIEACSVVDKCISKLVKFCEDHDIDMIITADHGNAEEMQDGKGGRVKKCHTTNDVPLIYFGKHNIKLRSGGLSDIAPTILDLLGIPKPQEMTGETLIFRS